MTHDPSSDLTTFEAHRARLLALAYRMLGDIGRAEDMVQEAWLRWASRRTDPDSERAYLVTLVTNLCLNELDSAKVRREESRGDRLPEPIDLDEAGIGRVEALDQVSMAFLVVLQRLTPAERAVLLLRDVFDFDYDEIASLVGKSGAACRKILERARENVGREKRAFSASREEHRRLLDAFMRAASAGDAAALVEVLSEDAVMVTDGGPTGRRVGNTSNLRQPLQGAAKIAAFVAATARNVELRPEIHELNGQPAAVLYGEQQAPFAAILLGVSEGRIHRVFFHADLARLRRLGWRAS
ncbi:MAG: polymerase sigma-70 factor [Labilithrix sp.]|nr:polymerase sigma-70 factor [Labilithrix sp.]